MGSFGMVWLKLVNLTNSRDAEWLDLTLESIVNSSDLKTTLPLSLRCPAFSQTTADKVYPLRRNLFRREKSYPTQNRLTRSELTVDTN
jgi:hypothetical protein